MTNEENIKTILECFFSGYKDEIIDSATKRILDTIELEPVLHAEWKEYTKISWYNIHCYRGCSQCGYARNDDNPDNDTPYCPNCGAKMDGG